MSMDSTSTDVGGQLVAGSAFNSVQGTRHHSTGSLCCLRCGGIFQEGSFKVNNIP